MEVLFDEPGLRGRYVVDRLGDGNAHVAVVRDPDARAGAPEFANRAHRVPVADKRVVVGLVHHGVRLGPAGGLVAAGAVAKDREAPDFIERNPVLNPAGQGPYHGVGIGRERVDRRAGRPAATVLEGLREIPVEERYPGRDPVLGHRVDQAPVKIEPGLVERAVAAGEDPGPRDRKPVVPDAQRAHQGEILPEPVVVVAGDVERVAVQHLAGNARKTVPYRLALAVTEGRALDLRRRRRGAPNEVAGEC